MANTAMEEWKKKWSNYTQNSGAQSAPAAADPSQKNSAMDEWKRQQEERMKDAQRRRDAMTSKESLEDLNTQRNAAIDVENTASRALSAAATDYRKTKDAAALRKLAQETIAARDERAAIDRKIDKIEYVDKYKDKVYDDTFAGQFGANKALGRIGQDTAAAYNEYIMDPTEENKAYADALAALQQHFQLQNEAALDDENAKATWITKSAAQYLPQLWDQTKAGIAGGAAGAAAGAGIGFVAGGGVGAIPGAIKGAKVGATAASGIYNYGQMRGAAYSELLAAGVDEETARAAANDEGVISGLLEMGDTALTIFSLGTGKLVTALGKGGVKAVAGEAADSGAKRLLKALGKYGVLNIGQEMLEEGSQQAVSIANRERATASTTPYYGRGNIDLNNRPVFNNADGTISTVDSTSFNIDGKEVLLPTVWMVNGRPYHSYDDEEVLQHYFETGEFLGIFDTPEEANEYAEQLHLDQADFYGDATKRTGIWNLVKGSASTAWDAITGENTEARDEILEASKEGGKIAAMFGGVQRVSDFAAETAVRSMIGKKYAGMGDNAVPALIETGLESEPGTESRKIAEKLQEKQKAGKEISSRELGSLVQAIESETDVQADAAVTATETPQKTLEGLAMETVAQRENIQQAKRMAEEAMNGQQEQPVQQESTPAPVPINVMSDNTPIRQQRIAEAKAFERSLGYGEKGMEAFNQIVEESGETPQQVRRFFQTAYETGMTGLPVEKAHIVTDVQRKAYYAGLADANIQAKAAQESAKLARTHQNAGFNLSDTSTDNLPQGMKLAAKPADVTDSQVQIVDNLAKKLGVRVRLVSGDSIQGNAEIHGNEVYISETFNRVQGGQNRSIVFYAAHEIGMHRLMKLAPDEGRAFINAIIQDKNSSRPSTASTVSQIRQEAYAEQDVYLSTAAAMEEISADSIMGLYESDEAFAEAIERVFRGNDEQAKEGARQYKNALDFVIQKLKEFIGKLTGKSKTEAKQALSELEHQRDLYERALKAAMNKTKSAVATKNATQDGDVKVQHSIYPSFAQQILNWDGKSKRVFKLGTTSEALKSIGVRDSEIRLKSGKATDILTNPDHDMDKDALAKIPLVLEYPIAILKSRQVTPENKKINDGNTSRLVIFGTIEDTKGVPLAVVLELLPTQGGKVLELSVVASAYGKTTHLRGFVQSSDVLYLDPDKKRTNSWLQSVGVQFPSDAINYGPLGIVTYSNGKVNIQGVPFKEISGADYIIAPKEETKSPMQIAMEKARSKQQEEGQHSLKDDASIEEMQAYLDKLNTEYRGLEQQDARFKEAPEYKALVDAISEARSGKKSLFDKPEALTKALDDYRVWQDESGYTEVIRRMEDMRGEMKTVRGRLDRAKEQAEKDAKVAYRAQYNEEFAKKYATKAAKKFGTTSRFDFAGYLTVNGSLLNFSGGQGYRVHDHREVAEVLDFLPEDHGYSDGMIEFMNLGNIRLQSYGIDIAKAPNAAQKAKLRQFFRSLDGEVSVDFSNENGDNMGSLEYNEGTRAERILNDIDTYFKTGKVPEQSVVTGFHSMYSLKEQNDLLKQNAKLKEVNRELRAQFKTTKFAKVDRKALNSFTKQLLKDYNSDVELEDARAALDGLYTYLANGENGESAMWQEAYDRAFEVSKAILESSRTMDDEMYRTYKALRDDLRKDGISIDQRYNHDLVGYDSIAEFKLANRGRIKISENGTPIDIYYQALALDYPEFFDADEVVTPADQLLHIEEVLNKLQPMEVNPFSHNLEEAATWLANDILERFFELPQAKPTFADKAERKLTRQMIKDQEKLDRLREEKNAKIAELIAENRDKLKDAVTAERMAAGREMGKLKQKYVERAEKAGERKKASILRARIIRHARDMSQKLLRPSDKQHIPDNLRGPVAALLDAINMESQYTIDPITGKRQKNGDGDPTKRTAAFDELRKAYKAIIEGDGEDIVVDPAIELMLDDVLAMRDVRLADMTSHQLKQVWDVLRVMEHTVSNAGKLLSQAKYARTVEWADAFVSDTKTRRGKKGTRMEGFRLDLENPYTFFSHYGDAGKEVFRMLRDAQDEQQVMVENVRKQVQEIVDSKTVRNLEKEVHEFTTERGDKLTLTTAQVMEVYLLMKREQAQAHLMQGGIVQPEIESKKIKRGTDAILLTANDLSAITGKLNAKQKEIANKLQALTSTTLADYGNKASMKAYGYKKFTGTDYWPIKSAREGIHANVEKGGNNTRSIKNIGLAKTVMPGANNPLDIGGAFKTFASHAADMIDYAAWLCPMEDANRLFNFQFRDDNGLRTGRTIKGLLDRVGGKGAQDYWHRLMEDIQNGIKTPADTSMMGTVNKVIGRARGASVGANIRVIIQQPTAIFRAGAVLSPEAMFRGMFIGGGWKTALKHSPIAMRKEMGGFDISSHMQMNEILFDSKTGLQRFNEAMMWGAGRADAVTWGRIWNACESEVMWDRKDLAPRSDAFYEAVNELFTEVVDQSQVVDGVLQRSQAMRSNDALLKQATAFMGEPTMAMNMMLRAYDGLINEQDAKKRGKALKTFGRTAAVLLITNVVNALAQSLVDADRDDEDDEYWKKFWNAFTGITGEEETAWEKATGAVLSGNFGSGLNPLGYIPFAKDILSIFQGYNVTRADADVMGDIINACKIFIGSVSGDGKKTIAYATKNLAQQVGKVFGISATNILRDVWGIARTIALETGNIPLQYEMEKAIYKVSNDGNLSRFVEVLYKAYQTDKDTYQHIYDDLIASGIDAEDIRDKMEKVMKKAENVKSVDDLEQRYLNPQFQSEYDSKMGTIQKNKLWSKASDAQRDKLEDNLYELIIGSKDGEKLQEKIDGGKSVGLDDTEYLLYRLALDMYDQPTENGKMGTFTQDEAEDAIAAIAGLTDKERAYLWQSTNKGWKEDKNPWR